MSSTNNPFYIVGHRGAAGERLENSLDGFKHAIELGIDAIELDIREHSHRLWVFHDQELKRLTGKPGLFEDQTDPSAIKLRNGELLPDLQQVLDLYWGRMPVNIEIKSVTNLQLMLDLLARYPAPESPLDAVSGLPWILISSFNHTALLELRKLGCRWPLAPISGGVPLQFNLELEQLAPYSWHFHDEYVDLDQVRYLSQLGVASMVFTVNHIDRAEFLKQQGVAGIFTDIPTQMRALR
jgi:glycerophosphoryl diester phosphodiesterase